MTHALKRAWRPQDSARAGFGDAYFTDIWNDAQKLRTVFVRDSVRSLVRRISCALINRSSAQTDIAIAARTSRTTEAPDAR